MAKGEVMLKEVNRSQWVSVFFRFIYSYCDISTSLLSLPLCMSVLILYDRKLQFVRTLFNRSKQMTTNPDYLSFDVRVQQETFVVRRVCY